MRTKYYWSLTAQLSDITKELYTRKSGKVLGGTKRQAATRDWPFTSTTAHTVDATAEERRKRSSLFLRGHQEREQQQQQQGVEELSADFINK